MQQLDFSSLSQPVIREEIRPYEGDISKAAALTVVGIMAFIGLGLLIDSQAPMLLVGGIGGLVAGLLFWQLFTDAKRKALVARFAKQNDLQFCLR